MDVIFQKVGKDGWKGVFTVVHQARVEPKWYGKDGELLVDGYKEAAEEKKRGQGVGPLGRQQGAMEIERTSGSESSSSGGGGGVGGGGVKS